MATGTNPARDCLSMPPDRLRIHMPLVSVTNAALSPEEIQTKAERWPLFWRFIWSGVLIAGTVAVATMVARWI
jgi:hypothetical protein